MTVLKSKRPFSQWVMPDTKRFHMGCCDCGLVHEMQFRIREGFVEYRVRRAPRYTAKMRNKMKLGVSA